MTRYGVMGCGRDGIVVDTHAQPIDAIVWRGPYAIACEVAQRSNVARAAYPVESFPGHARVDFEADMIGRELGRAIVERARADKCTNPG